MADGRITSVSTSRFGSELEAAAAVGATVLVVSDNFHFSEAGGWVKVGSQVLPYTTVAPDAADQGGTLTLGAPTTAAYAAGEFVYRCNADGEVDELKVAETDGGPFVVAHEQSDLRVFREGIRAAGTGEAVVLRRSDPADPTSPLTGQVAEATPLQRDVSYADPTTNFPPGTLSDGAPPASSPVPTVLPGVGAAVVMWPASDNADPVMYRLYVAASNVDPPSTANLLSDGATPPTWVRHLPGTTTPLPYDADTWFALAAYDADGAATASPWVAGRPKKAEPSDILLSVDTLLANQVLAEALQASEFTAANATVTAHLVAQTLTALGQMTARGTLEIARTGAIRLRAGVTAPTTPLTPQVVWDSLPVTGSTLVGPRDLFWFSGSWYRVGTVGGVTAIEQVDPATGAVAATTVATGSPAGAFTPRSLVRVGASWYALGYEQLSGYLMVRVYSAAMVYTTQWSTGTPGESMPYSMGTDGTNLVLARRYNDSVTDLRLRFYTFTPAGVQIGSSLYADTNLAAGQEVQSLFVGAADFGATRYAAAVAGSTATDVRTYTTAGAEQANEKFPTPVPGAQALGWDGANFWSATATTLHKHTATTWTTESSKWWAASTWYDSDVAGTGVHETPMGPQVSFTMKRRAKATLTSAAVPDYGDPDDPDMFRVYLGRGGTAPARTAMWRQADPAAGATVATYSAVVFSGTNPPAAGDFPGGVGAPLLTDAGGFILNADGSGTPGTGGFRDNVRAAVETGGTTWTTPNLTAPYTAGAGLEPRYRRDAANNVHIQGAALLNGAVDGATIFTLPAGFRPSRQTRYVNDTTPLVTSSERIVIETDGQVKGYLKTGVPTRYYLDGVFSAA